MRYWSGNSFFARSCGFGCSNVDNFEVVLADGSVVNANAKENPDLWLGLGCGSENLGLVTRFDMRTTEYADSSNLPHLGWWIAVASERRECCRLVDAMMRFADRIPGDPTSGSYCIFAWVPGLAFPGSSAISCALDNILNVAAPPAFDDYFAIEGVATSTLRSRALFESDDGSGFSNSHLVYKR